MSFERQHQDLHVTLTRDRAGSIVKADLEQGEPAPSVGPVESIQLTPYQLYALVDDVAVADPNEWSRRFDPRGPTELALRRVADYCRTKGKEYLDLAGPAKDPIRARYINLAEGMRQAMMQTLLEIEALYPEQNPTQAVNDSLNRRSQ